MPSARLIVGSSESCADLLYATRFFVPDDMIWFEWKGKTHAVLSPLEIDRARATAKVDKIIASSDIEKKLKGKFPRRGQDEVLVRVLKDHGIKKVEVSAGFPFGLAEKLKKSRIGVAVCGGMFFPGRELKTAAEISFIIRGQRQAEAGLAAGLEVLRRSRAGRDRKLRWGGQVLTSEILRGEIDAAVVRVGGLPAHTIVAGGDQACDPHEGGHGPLKAGESIILDIFPRDQKSGYFGDLTRTVVKGKAPEALRKLHATVAEGQKLALKSLKAGVDGGKLHEKVKSFFTEKGYPTEQRDGRWVGFFHGTGHSLGLEIHEPPRFAAGKFRAGQVMTVEPGLYYPGLGGVRIEDLVVIGAQRVRNLTKAPQVFELR